MLQSRDDIRKDKAVDAFTDAILQRDQPRTAELFFNLVRRDGRSMGDALSVVTEAEAPFVQVPNHVDVRDGQITLINNDHTILGLRTSADLTQYLPEEYRLLGMLQSVWYIPAGLDIWNQLRGKYPGRYATMKGMNVPPPSYGPVVWNDDQEPIVEAGGVRGPAARAHDRHDERRREALLWPVPWPRGRRSGAAEAARPDAVPRADRSAGHGDGPQGAQHRPQGAARARRGGSRRAYRLGARARRLLYRRAGHGDRAAVLFAVRRRLRDGDRGVPRCRQEPEADQPGAADAGSRSRTWSGC